jgi:hypothetical protein
MTSSSPFWTTALEAKDAKIGDVVRLVCGCIATADKVTHNYGYLRVTLLQKCPHWRIAYRGGCQTFTLRNTRDKDGNQHLYVRPRATVFKLDTFAVMVMDSFKENSNAA